MTTTYEQNFINERVSYKEVSLKDLIFYINKNFDRFDILELAKATHDFV